MKNIIIALVGKDFYMFLTDAWAFATNKDARVLSTHKYPSGRYMSIREAKNKKLM